MKSNNSAESVMACVAGLRGFRAKLNIHAPLAPEYKIAIFNPEQSSFSVYMLPEWNSHQSENLIQNENRNDLYGNRFCLGNIWTDTKKYKEWTCSGMKWK